MQLSDTEIRARMPALQKNRKDSLLIQVEVGWGRYSAIHSIRNASGVYLYLQSSLGRKHSVDYIKCNTDLMPVPFTQYSWQKRRLKMVWFWLSQYSSLFCLTRIYSVTSGPKAFFNLWVSVWSSLTSGLLNLLMLLFLIYLTLIYTVHSSLQSHLLFAVQKKALNYHSFTLIHWEQKQRWVY